MTRLAIVALTPRPASHIAALLMHRQLDDLHDYLRSLRRDLRGGPGACLHDS